MESKILEIVVYLIDHIRENQGQLNNMDDVSSDLRSMGYTDNEISSAYCWVMDRYGSNDQVYYSEFPEEHYSLRVLTQAERFTFTTEAYGFLIRLLNMSLVDDEQFEAILDRGAMLGPKPVDLEHLKLLASSYVFSEPGETDAFSWLDADGSSLRIH